MSCRLSSLGFISFRMCFLASCLCAITLRMRSIVHS
jgi:hypothetical protein